MAYYRLPAPVITQIENALELLLEESGYGEIVLPVAHGQLLGHIECRPIVRMVLPRSENGPQPAILDRHNTRQA